MSVSADERNVPRDRNVGMLPGAFHRGDALMFFSAEKPFILNEAEEQQI